MHGQSESKFRLRRGSIYRRLCIHLSLVVRASMPFFFSLLPPLLLPSSFASIKRCRAHTHVHFASVSHRIQFPFFLSIRPLIDHRFIRASLQRQLTTLLLTSQLRSRVHHIDGRLDSYGLRLTLSIRERGGEGGGRFVACTRPNVNQFRPPKSRSYPLSLPLE